MTRIVYKETVERWTTVEMPEVSPNSTPSDIEDICRTDMMITVIDKGWDEENVVDYSFELADEEGLWSVLIAYTDTLEKPETYLAHVRADTIETAQIAAVEEMSAANGVEDIEYAILAVFEGHLTDYKIEVQDEQQP